MHNMHDLYTLMVCYEPTIHLTIQFNELYTALSLDVAN